MNNIPTSARVDVTRRPDGRTYLSVEAWSPDAFVSAARDVLRVAPRPVHTLVDETDAAGLSLWRSLGFAELRREAAYVLGVDAPRRPTAGRSATIEPFGAAEGDRLAVLHDRVRAEVDAELGWHRMPAQLVAAPPAAQAARCAVALREGRDVGLVRVTGRERQPRISLLAVLRSERRRGVGSALVSYALDVLAERGAESVIVEVDEANHPALRLVTRFDGRRVGGLVELVCR